MFELSRRWLIVLPAVGVLSGCSLKMSVVVLEVDPNLALLSLSAFENYAIENGYRNVSWQNELGFERVGREARMAVLHHRIPAESPFVTFEVSFQLVEWEFFGRVPDVDEMAANFERFALGLEGVRLRARQG